MPSLQDMALVDLQDGKGPRHIPGISWSPVSHKFEATMADPEGNKMFLGCFETPSQAIEAIESMTKTFAKLKAYGTKVGGPKPQAAPSGASQAASKAKPYE